MLAAFVEIFTLTYTIVFKMDIAVVGFQIF